jgi:hypothetical protein
MFALVRKEILLPSMERRKFIKGIAAAGGITWVSHWISLLGLDQALTAKPTFAIPIRALANKGGKLVQPIQLTIEHAGSDATLVVRVNHREGESRVLPLWWVSPSGNERVLVWVPWTGYAMSHVMKLDTRLVNEYQARLDEVGFPLSDFLYPVVGPWRQCGT